MHPRVLLADTLRALGTLPARTVVYDHPADVTKLPAVVIQAAGVVADTLDKDRYTLEATCMVQRANLAAGYTALDNTTAAIRVGVFGSIFRFVESGAYEQGEQNGLETLQCTMSLDAVGVTQGE